MILGKLGQVGSILAPNRSLQVGLARLFLSHRSPVSRGWAESWKKSMSRFCCNYPKVIVLLRCCEHSYLPASHSWWLLFTACLFWARAHLGFCALSH